YAVAPAPLREVDLWLERFRGFWGQRLDALATELARGEREGRTRHTAGPSSSRATPAARSSQPAADRPPGAVPPLTRGLHRTPPQGRPGRGCAMAYARLRAPQEQRKEWRMSRVRVLVGTRKGAFVLTSDGKREQWEVSGPQFAGWEIYHLKGSPADPDRLYASQSSSWFGQGIQRSDDGGKTWESAGNEFAYDGVPGTHQWYDGPQHPWAFARVWHLEPSLTDPDTVYAGVEDAAMFRTVDAGRTWQELSGLRRHTSGPSWQPGAGGMCLHTILLDPTRPDRIFVAISAAGAFRTDDGG